MMNESGDDTNHESTFEIINAQHETTGPPEAPPPVSTLGSVPNLPPPAALPAFASLSGSTFAASSLPPGPPGAPPPSSQPAPPPKSAETTSHGGGNPFSIRATSGSSQHHHQQPQQPVVMPPMPMQALPVMMPTPSLNEGTANVAFGGGPSQQMGTGVEIPFDMLSHGHTLTAMSDDGTSAQQQAGSGVWGWFRGAVHNSPLLTKVVENAKSSVDSVIATLDPQMKEYQSNRGLMDVVITLDRDEEIRGMKDGLTRVFPTANIRPFVVTAGLNVAAQANSFASACQVAYQKIAYVRNSGYVDQASLIIGNEGFIIEAMPDTWLYFDCLVLDDTARQIQVNSCTQPVQVPNDIVQVLKEQTHADYPYKESGYAMSINHAMTHLWSLGPLEWQERLSGVTRMEFLKNAALALAYSYRGKL